MQLLHLAGSVLVFSISHLNFLFIQLHLKGNHFACAPSSPSLFQPPIRPLSPYLLYGYHWALSSARPPSFLVHTERAPSPTDAIPRSGFLTSAAVSTIGTIHSFLRSLLRPFWSILQLLFIIDSRCRLTSSLPCLGPNAP